MFSTPSVFEYSPEEIQWQKELLTDVFCNFDYSKGTYEIMLSGSVGSGKSLPAAHIGVRHCLEYARARLLICRKALPDLKDTLFKKICEHLECEELRRGVDYDINETRAYIAFRNGSEIIGRSWADRKYKKLGSYEASAAIIEEASENDQEDERAYEYLTMRVGRLPHVPQKFILVCTNPDEPSHWLYRRFIQNPKGLTKVYYSLLKDNPYLPPEYEQNLRRNLDPKMAKRMLDGEWLSIDRERIYHQYQEPNFMRHNYEINPRLPIYLSWDFNIGEGKPLSMSLSQINQEGAHFFGEVIIHGIRTEDSCYELHEKGWLNYPTKYIITGDASGSHKDTRNKNSDYDIIRKFFANYQQTRQNQKTYIQFEMQVPRINPPVRERHNLVNAWCQNALGERRLFVYASAPTIDKALRLTKLRKGGQYIEDDSTEDQHVGTTVGYAIHTFALNQNQSAVEILAR